MYVHIVDLILDSTVTRNKPAKKHKVERRDSSADTCDPPSSPEKKLQKSVHIQTAAATFTTNKHPQKHPVEHRDSSADTCDPRSSPEKKMQKSTQRKTEKRPDSNGSASRCKCKLPSTVLSKSKSV